MTPLFSLSELARSLFSFWTLFLCVIGIFTMILSATQKRYRVALLALIPFGCSYFLWQVLFDLHLFAGTEKVVAVSREIGKLPWLFLLLSLLLLTGAALILLQTVIRYGRRSVTPDAVKHCLDQMPCGICCWCENGRVLFSNICMNRLCFALTGSPLLNGNQFCEAAGNEILTVKGRRWRFACRDIVLDGECLHEMIASDITAEYAKTQALERDKAELSRLNRELKEYTAGIDDTVRRQEILQAKVNIHDEMNRLMLSTMAAEKEDTAALDDIFSLWEKNALLLCMEASRMADTAAETRMEKLAKALKIRLIRRDNLPPWLSEKQRSLYFSAAQEAIANAAKHAKARTMTVSLEETESDLSCSFTNDGQIPGGEVRFAGGLQNLSVLAGKQGADLFARTGETFTLTLRFPKNQPNG